MDEVISVSTNEQLIGEHHLPDSCVFKNLYDASLETGFSEAEIVSHCGRVWMDCGLNRNDIGKDFTKSLEHTKISTWLGFGSVCGKRAMPLWGELTRDSVSALIGRLRNANRDLRGLWVHETNYLWEEDVKLLSFNGLELDLELLTSTEKYFPDQPVLYIDSVKLKEFLSESADQQKFTTTQEVTVNVLKHEEVNTLIQHAEFFQLHHNPDTKSDPSNASSNADKNTEKSRSFSSAEQLDAQQNQPETFKSEHSGAGCAN